MTIRILFSLLVVSVLSLLAVRLVTGVHAARRTHEAGEVEPERAAIVFGAGLTHDGSPSPVLRDRIITAAELYFSGKVEKLLMSGDNRFVEYNEPAAMRSYALGLGVPAEAIVLDYAGRRTYDTCYRAREIFGLERAILVTQGFHLPRALFTCQVLGVKASGVKADRRPYAPFLMFFWHTRELLATVTAVWELYVTHPLPVLGEFEPIFPEST